MKFSTLIASAVFFIASSTARATSLSDQFAEGLSRTSAVVGCLSDLIVTRNEDCLAQEKTIRLGKQLYSEDDGKFISVVSGKLNEIKDASSYRYLAILISTLSKDRRLAPALRKASEVEIKSKLPFKYAASSLERILNGSCKTSGENSRELREICTADDQIFNRIGLSKGLR